MSYCYWLFVVVDCSFAGEEGYQLDGPFQRHDGNAPWAGSHRLMPIKREERNRGRIRRCSWRLVGGLGVEENAPIAARRRA
jgi:hypothetical protein